MNQDYSISTEKLKTRCNEIIDLFHHRGALRDDDIRAWVSTVVRSHGDAAIWHATRAGGFGGSDIGVLARNFSGHRADHMNSAHDIIQSKLLKSVPDEDAGDLRRGHENEPLHAEKYYAKYAASRDGAAFDLLSKSQGLRVWMRYSPDDVVLLPANQPNPALGGLHARRLLIDYKAPRVVNPTDAVAFQYACQLHQGAMICSKAGIHLDGLMLSQYNWAEWSLKDDNIPYDPEISKLILQAGDHYYGYAMRGELPPYIFTPKFDREQEFIDAFGQKAQRMAHISAIGKAHVDESDQIGQEIKESLKDLRLAGKKMQLGDLTVTAVNMVDHAKINELLSKPEIALLRKKDKPEYDVTAMALKLLELGGDPELFRIDKIDADKAYPYLIEKGFDPEQFMSEQIRFKVSNFLKDAARQLVLESFPIEKDALIEEVLDVSIEASCDSNKASPNPSKQDEKTPVGNADIALIFKEIAVVDSTEQDVREALFAERPAQRTAMV